MKVHELEYVYQGLRLMIVGGINTLGSCDLGGQVIVV